MCPKKKAYWDNRFEGEPFPWGQAKSGLAGIALRWFRDSNANRVLDVGCGSGRDSIYFARKGFPVVGIDPSALAVRIARGWAKRNKVKIRFLREDIQSTSLKPGSFGGVFSYNTLHLLPLKAQARAAKNLARLLKPGGTLVLAAFSAQEKSMRRGRPVHRFTRKELLELFSPFFEIVELKRMDFPEEHGGTKHSHKEWLLVARKK